MQSIYHRARGASHIVELLKFSMGLASPTGRWKQNFTYTVQKDTYYFFSLKLDIEGIKKGTVYVNFWFILTPWATCWPLGYVHWQIDLSFCGIGLQNRLLPVVQLDPATLTFKRSSFMTWAVCWLWGKVYKISYVSFFFGPIWTLKWSSTYCGTWTSNLRNYKWVILHPELSADCVCMGDSCCMIAFIFI